MNKKQIANEFFQIVQSGGNCSNSMIGMFRNIIEALPDDPEPPKPEEIWSDGYSVFNQRYPMPSFAKRYREIL